MGEIAAKNSIIHRKTENAKSIFHFDIKKYIIEPAKPYASQEQFPGIRKPASAGFNIHTDMVFFSLVRGNNM